MSDHLGLYSRIDIALDTFPYNGTTTTCEALWMGLPVITLAGSRHAGRVGVSLLSQVGMDEFIADDKRAYVEVAARLAGDREKLRRLRVDLRKRLAGSALCNSVAFVQNVENAYRNMWLAWCGQT